MTKVLIIDDSREQLNAACAVAHRRKWEFIRCDASFCSTKIWMKEMAGVDGVLTDLMWEHKVDGMDKAMKPMGLLVVIHALLVGKPVVVCTNAGDCDGGHHGPDLSWIHDGYISYQLQSESQPFGWVENKDWNKAADLLASYLVLPGC